MIGALFSLLVYLLIIGIMWWGGNQVLAILAPYIAEPFMSLIRVILILILCVLLISILLQLIGAGGSLGIHLPMLRF